MLPIEKFSIDQPNDRQLFVLELDNAEINERIALPTPHFACLIAWDSEHAQDETILELLRKIVASGAAFICCWGSGCERVHDFADNIDIELNSSSDDNFIMTTWHAKEALSETLWFLLNSTWPAEYAEDTMGSTIAISVGNADYAQEMRNAFRNPKTFSAELLRNGDDAL